MTMPLPILTLSLCVASWDILCILSLVFKIREDRVFVYHTLYGIENGIGMTSIVKHNNLPDIYKPCSK